MYDTRSKEFIKEEIKKLEIDVACLQAKSLINTHFSKQPKQGVMSEVTGLLLKSTVNTGNLAPDFGSIDKAFYDNVGRHAYRVTDTFSTRILQKNNDSINKTVEEMSQESQKAMQDLKDELLNKLPGHKIIPLLPNISKFLTKACLIPSFDATGAKDNQSFLFKQSNFNDSFEIMIKENEIHFKLATDLDIFFMNEKTENILGYVRAERIVIAPLSLFTDYDWNHSKGGETLFTQITVSDTQTTHLYPKSEIKKTPISEEYMKEDNTAAQHLSPPKPPKSILKKHK
jgi:hypothetical protein